MPFGLPETVDIAVEIDARRFHGAYSFMLGDMIVYYNGHSKSVRKPEANVDEIALKMLRELVRENFVGMDSVPADLPQHMREAALEYANYLRNGQNDSAVETIFEAWGTHSEGCWPENEERPYERWFVQEALPSAYRCKSVC